jgi:hypothetical protein
VEVPARVALEASPAEHVHETNDNAETNSNNGNVNVPARVALEASLVETNDSNENVGMPARVALEASPAEHDHETNDLAETNSNNENVGVPARVALEAFPAEHDRETNDHARRIRNNGNVDVPQESPWRPLLLSTTTKPMGLHCWTHVVCLLCESLVSSVLAWHPNLFFSFLLLCSLILA